jgi:hypothetical protein
VAREFQLTLSLQFINNPLAIAIVASVRFFLVFRWLPGKLGFRSINRYDGAIDTGGE